MNELKVDMADYKVSSSPNTLLATAVGSCVAVCLYDQQKRNGGLAHIMLPSSKDREVFNPNRYANLAIASMLEKLETMGSLFNNLDAKIVGGANLFPFLLKEDHEQMGFRNVTAVKEILKSQSIKVIAEHTGGNIGRSVKFSLETGIVTVEIKI